MYCFRDLDSAVLRRFEKRINIDLPTHQGRVELFKYFLNQNGYSFNENDYLKMAGVTELFSGSDIRLVCKEICMSVFRKKLIVLKKIGR